MNPNLTQVGGDHYRSPFQHWDLVVALNLGYFEGVITKYVTRHHKKNGSQDLQKALHFLIKLMDLAQNSGYTNRALYAVQHSMQHSILYDYAQANGLAAEEAKVIQFVCRWRTIDQLKLAERALMNLVALRYPTGLPAPIKRTDEERTVMIDGDMFRGVQHDDGDAGPGYVNQDR